MTRIPTPTCGCLITRVSAGRTELLLGLKRRGFGKGRIVEPGGHLEPGETAREACVREVGEEVGLVVRPDALVPAGGVTFLFPARPEWDLHVELFRTDRFTGSPVDSDELAPAWYPVEDLPWSQMWPDGRYWLPRVLAGEVVRAEFTIGEDGESVTNAIFHDMFHVEHDA